MLLQTRCFLLILLGLLQLVAPLVHAHSGRTFAQFGWHLPTFEIFSVNVDTRNSRPRLQAVDLNDTIDSAIISISTGIKQPKSAIDDPKQPIKLTKQIIFNLFFIHQRINFSPHFAQNFKTCVYHPQIPRAPPAILGV
jgi:hypothetical protein